MTSVPPEELLAAHPTNGLDDTVHQRHRLGILTITAEARAEFGYLRDALGLTAGNLSRHLTVLEEAGLIRVEKGYAGRRRGPGSGSPAPAAPRSPPRSMRWPNWCAGIAADTTAAQLPGRCDGPPAPPPGAHR